MFKKILIANRGEIACRVIKSARKMGIKTVAVYSEADKDALHVELADEAVCIGPAPTNQSYLVVENIMKAIKDTKAQAVHPGYGFLSENAAFCRKLQKEKIAFIGPKPRAITAMGDKIESKKLADKAGVNTIPGYTDAIKDAKEAVKIADKIGYPVMIKASAGGGGKGMRVAWNSEEAKDGFQRATNEAKASFGDDRVFIEKFIEQPRHIEIQILADQHGNCLYLNERECSIQRRHQKVLEEAPSPFISAETRKAMGEQAVALAKAVKYESAGTVEFIVDKDQNFYFLEMNTRLQVEHPVTEYITGLDLVEWMIKIADGQKLTIKQKEVKLEGWALEARVYAEDPLRGFLPSIGRLVRYQEPDTNENVRVDSGVYEGGEISMYYDPMIAKLITYGKDRDEAIHRMRQALDQYHIKGVSHNMSFLAALVNHPRFVAGDMTTNFIAEEYPDGFNPSDLVSDDPNMIIAVAASIHRRYMDRAAGITGQMEGHERKVGRHWDVVIKGKDVPVTVDPIEGGHLVTVKKKTHEVLSDWTFGKPRFRGTVDGKPVTLQLERRNIRYVLMHAGSSTEVMVLNPRAARFQALMPKKAAPDMTKYVQSPMPGLLVSVAVEVGQEVKSGEEVAVIEAMKMENVLRAERDGKVVKIHAEAGASLAVDEIIVEFE